MVFFYSFNWMSYFIGELTFFIQCLVETYYFGTQHKLLQTEMFLPFFRRNGCYSNIFIIFILECPEIFEKFSVDNFIILLKIEKIIPICQTFGIVYYCWNVSIKKNFVVILIPWEKCTQIWCTKKVGIKFFLWILL